MRQPLNKIIRVATVLLIALLLSPAKPCLAAGIASPDTITVNSIQAYQSTIHTGDQFYLVSFTLGYATNPDDDATTNFLLRFVDNGTEIASVAPYSFYDDGYSDGVVSFYFDNDDPNLPTWNENDIEIELTGNPSLTWADGDPPSTSNPTVDSWNSGTSLIAGRVRVLATQLESAYGVDMIEMINSSLKLTAYGLDYFETVIANLGLLAPDVLSTSVTSPVFSSDNKTLVTKTTLESRLTGTPFDQSAMETEIGVPEMWMYSIIWLIFTGIVVFFYATRIGTIGLNWIIAMALEVGAFGGWMPTEVAVGLGILGGALIIYPLFFRSASI